MAAYCPNCGQPTAAAGPGRGGAGGAVTIAPLPPSPAAIADAVVAAIKEYLAERDER